MGDTPNEIGTFSNFQVVREGRGSSQNIETDLGYGLQMRFTAKADGGFGQRIALKDVGELVNLVHKDF